MKLSKSLLVLVALLAAAMPVAGAGPHSAVDLGRYEGRTVASVNVEAEGATVEDAALNEFRALLRIEQGGRFSAVLIRESLQALFDTGRVANARVVAMDAPGPAGEDGRPRVALRFVIRPQVLVNEVRIELDAPPDAGIEADEVRGRLNLVEPGRRISEQALRQNADLIQVYLRDRGYYRAEVEYSTQLDPTRTRATVVYRVAPGAPTLFSDFTFNVEGFDPAPVRADLRLQPGERFTQERLGESVAQVRRAIIAQGFLSPRIESDVRLDSAENRISVTLSGSVGPQVEVHVTGYELSERRQRELFPVLREGTIDPSAIVEGQRRLRNRLQEEGYFFAQVNNVCAINPPLAPPPDPGEGEENVCNLLVPEDLAGRSVTLTYEVERGRRFELRDIDVVGTDALTFEDVERDLRSREATILGIIPFFGFGRGYTSEDALAQDARLIRSRMVDLGYRQARVEVRRGVSLDSDNLIITFAVDEGPLTRVAGIDVRGNQIHTAERLREVRCPGTLPPGESCISEGEAFSRSRARADGERLRYFYARQGYFDADVDLSVINLPSVPGSNEERVRLIYDVVESDKVFINQIVVNGLVRTDREAVLEAIPLRPGAVLRADELLESERVLLTTTDAFRQVIIRTEAHGETQGGFKRRDVIIDIEERPPITTDYVVGYSTDNGPLGGFDARHANLFGQLRQGSLRSRFSRRQQLVRLEYFDPRFQRYGEKEFAPLTATVQYQRDTNVTRFFRSTIDRGAEGLVQRFNEEGEIVDEFGRRVREPSINRFLINLETQRDLELELTPQGAVSKRSTLFLRYNYEDVRLFNIGSLLIAPILRPDQAVRLSRLGASFARDTRDRRFDPTRGDFISVDYALSLKPLGGSISYSRLQAAYSRYYRVNRVRETVLAASVQFGLAGLFSVTDRNGDGLIDEADRRLPISERFFSGGATTLRGFRFEEAGPRVVAPFCNYGPPAVTPNPCGQFRNQEGELVTLNPFTVPIGGNALAVVNLEARVGVSRDIQAVPFYDGGNVFRNVRDIFGEPDLPGSSPQERNLNAKWTHTVGLGFRFKTPIGALGVDYGYLLNPPEFVIPQFGGGTAIHRLPRSQIHFRFGQTF